MIHLQGCIPFIAFSKVYIGDYSWNLESVGPFEKLHTITLLQTGRPGALFVNTVTVKKHCDPGNKTLLNNDIVWSVIGQYILIQMKKRNEIYSKF